MDLLENLLSDLHLKIEKNDQTADFTASITSIESLVLASTNDVEQTSFAFLLFSSSEPGSLLQFIEKTIKVKDRDIIRSKVNALKFLALYIKIMPQYFEIHSLNSFKLLNSIFRKEESGEVKTAILLLLKNILRTRISIPSDAISFIALPFDYQEIQLDTCYQNFIDELKYSKKISKGVFSETLKFLGLLISVYPNHQFTINNIPTIVDLAVSTLNKNFDPKCKEPDFSAISGAFSCLDRLLNHFDDRINDLTILWKYLLQTVQSTTQVDVSRYSAAGKAFRFIKNHAELFKDLIGLNASKSYEIIKLGYQSGKKAILKHAYDALNAVITQMSSFLIENIKSNEQSKMEQISQTLLQLAFSYIDGLKSNLPENIIIDNLRNLISILPALVAISFVEDVYDVHSLKNKLSLEKIIFDIIEISENDHRKSNATSLVDETNKNILNLSNYEFYKFSLLFSVVVNILFNIHMISLFNEVAFQDFCRYFCNLSLQQYLEKYFTISVISYPTFWKKQQLVVNQSLSRFVLICQNAGNVRLYKWPNTKEESIHLLSETPFLLENNLNLFIKTLIIRSISRKNVNEKLSPESVRISEYTFDIEDRLYYSYQPLWDAIFQIEDKQLRFLLIKSFGNGIFTNIESQLFTIVINQLIEVINSLDLTCIELGFENINSSADLTFLPNNIVDQDLFINLVSFMEMFIPKVSDMNVQIQNHSFLFIFLNFSERYYMISGFYRILSLFLISHHSLETNIIEKAKRFILLIQEKISTSSNLFKDELLSTSLHLIITCPVDWFSIQEILPSIIFSLKSNVNVSLTIDKLSHYYLLFPQSFLLVSSDIIPLLEKYLSPENRSFNSKVTSSIQYKSKSTKTNKLTGKGFENESDSLNIKILEFLGRMGCFSQSILKPPSSTVSEALNWSPETLISIQFDGNMNVISNSSTFLESSNFSLTLDQLIHRIVNLSDSILSSPEDQQFTMILETIHSLVIISLGKVAANPLENRQLSSSLLIKMYPILIMLACKPGRAQILFETLLIQVVHWFSSDLIISSQYREDLFEVIFDILSGEKSQTLTCVDICANCLCESINSMALSKNQSSSVHIIFDKIFTLMSHPLEKNRKISLILVSKFLKIVNQDINLLQQYILALFYNTFLLFIYDNSPSLTNEIETVVSKIRDTMIFSIAKQSDQGGLLISSEKRNFPQSLNDLVIWLWETSISDSNVSLRQRSMKSFISLCVLFEATEHDVKHVKSFFNRWIQLKQTGSSVKSKQSKNFLSSLDLALSEIILKDSNSQSQIIVLDVYKWLFQIDLISFIEMEQLFSNSPNFSSFHNLVSNSSLITSQLDLIISYLQFLNIFIQKDTEKTFYVWNFLISNEYWSDQFGSQLLKYLRHNFSSKDQNLIQEFTSQLFILLKSLPESLTGTFILNELSECILSICSYLWSLTLLEDVSPTFLTELSIYRQFLFLIKSSNLRLLLFLDHTSYFFNLIGIMTIKVAFCLLEINPNKNNLNSNALIEFAFDCDIHFSRFQVPQIINNNRTNNLFNSIFIYFRQFGWKDKIESMIGLLEDEYSLTLLLQKFQTPLIHVLLLENTPTSLYSITNLDILLKAFLTPKSNSSFFLVLLVELSSNIRGISEFNQRFICNEFFGLIVNHLNQFKIRNAENEIYDKVISLLLTIQSQLSTLGLFSSESKDIRKLVIEDCIFSFENASKLNIDKLIIRIDWLAYLLPGLLETSPYSKESLSLDRSYLTKLLEMIEEVMAVKFPLSSSDIQPTSQQGVEYLKILQAFLTLLEKLGSPPLLSLLLPSLREGERHIYFNFISKTFQRIAENLDVSTENNNKIYDNIYELMNFCVAILVDQYQEITLKSVIFNYLFLPILKNLNSSQLTEIFTVDNLTNNLLRSSISSSPMENITTSSFVRTFFDVISMDINKVNFKNSDESINQLFLYSISFNCFEFLYDRCTVNDIKGPLTKAYLGPNSSNTGKELTQNLCRTAYKLSRINIFVEDKAAKDQLNLLIANAYKCLAVVVSKTQTEEQFFDNFLFKSKTLDELWLNIIPNDYPINFTEIFSIKTSRFITEILGSAQFTMSLPSKKDTSKVSKINKLALKARKEAGKGGFLSQFLDDSIASNSTLAANLLKIDKPTISQSMLTQSQFLSQEIEFKTTSISQKLTASQDPESVTYSEYNIEEQGNNIHGWDDIAIYLEMNELNRIPIMGTMVRVIQRMNSLFSTKWKSDLLTVPKWINELLNTSLNTFSSKLVKLFVLRLFMNQPVSNIIVPWLPLIYTNILKLASSELFQPESPSTGFHYNLRDFLFSICDSWKEYATLSSTEGYIHASNIMNYLLSNFFNEDSDILRENVLTLNLLFKHWLHSSSRNDVNRFQLNLQPLLKLLKVDAGITGGAHAKSSSQGSIAVRSILASLDIIRNLLLLNYPFFQKSSIGLDPDIIIDAILSNIKFPRKEIMESSCSLLGIILSKVSQIDTNIEYTLNLTSSKLIETSRAYIDSKYISKDGEESIILCFTSIIEQYPLYLTRELLMKTLSWFPKLKPKSKYEYLLMLNNTSIEYEDTNIVELFRPYLKNLLNDLSTISFGKGSRIYHLNAIQINILIFLTKYASTISLDILTLILGQNDSEGLRLCCGFQSPVQVRLAGYYFIMELFKNNLNFDRSQKPSNSIDPIFTSLTKLLLKGLLDSDESGMFNNRTGPIQTKYLLSKDYENAEYWKESNFQRLGIRVLVFDYFHSEFGLSDHPALRLKYLMENLFDPLDCENWLKFSSYLLLSLFQSSNNNNFIINHKLLTENPQVEELNLSGPVSKGSTQRFSTQTPMFALEKTSQVIATISSQINSQSQVLSLKAPNTFVSQSNLTASQTFINNTKDGPSQNLLNFSNGKAILKKKGTQQISLSQIQSDSTPQDNSDLNKVDKGSKLNPDILSEIIQRVPIRFSKSSSQMTSQNENNENSSSTKPKNYAMLGAIQTARRIAKESAKVNRVNFFRTYSKSDLPDLSLRVSDFLKPLQNICLMDLSIASIVFEILATAIISKYSEMTSSFSQIIITMIKLGDNKGMPISVISLLMSLVNRVHLENKILTDSDKELVGLVQIISKLSVESGTYFHGLQIIENILISENAIKPAVNDTSQTLAPIKGRKSKSKSSSSNDPISQTSKRRKTDTSSISTSFDNIEDSNQSQDFFELQSISNSGPNPHPTLDVKSFNLKYASLLKLYDELNENEASLGLIYRAVGNGFVGIETKKALDAELKGDFLQAIKIYSSLLESDLELKQRRTVDFGNNTQVISKQEERSWWYERNLVCLNKLAEWEMMENFIDNYEKDSFDESSMELESLQSELGVHYNITQKYRLKAKLHQCCSLDGIQDEELSGTFNFIDNLLSSSNKAWFETNCTVDLALGYVMNQNLAKAKMFIEKAYNEFSNKWVTIHPCAYEARKLLLLNLQRVVEIKDSLYLQFPKEISVPIILKSESYIKKPPNPTLANFIQIWQVSQPSTIDPLSVWSDLELLRSITLNRIEPEELSAISSLHLADLAVKQASASIKQNQLSKVKPFLESNNFFRKKVFGKNIILSLDEVRLVISYNQKNILDISENKSGKTEEIQALVQKTNKMMSMKLEQITQNTSNFEEKLQMHLLFGKWHTFISKYQKILSSSESRVEMEQKNDSMALHHFLKSIETIDKLPQKSILERDKIFALTSQLGLYLLQKAEKENTLTDSSISEMMNLWQISIPSLFKSLNIPNLKELSNLNDEMSSAYISILSFIEGFKAQSEYCQEHVLVFISLLASYQDRIPGIFDYFKSQLDLIPMNIFLKYSSQLFSNLSVSSCLNSSNAINKTNIFMLILKKLAKNFPHRLYYSYYLLLEQNCPGLLRGERVDFSQSKLLQCILELKEDLLNSNINALIEAFTGLTSPKLRVLDFLNEVKATLPLIQSKKQPTNNRVSSSKGKATNSIDLSLTSNNLDYLKLFESCVSFYQYNFCLTWPNVGKLIGKYNQTFVLYMQKEVLPLFQLSVDKIKDWTIKSIVDYILNFLFNCKDLGSLINKIKDALERKIPYSIDINSGKINLNELSQWLAQYQFRSCLTKTDSFMDAIELPCVNKYDDFKDCEYIRSFDSQILVMSSLRKPKRIKIYGTQGNSQYFLVKGGEDLRNDERIELLFGLMNSIITKNPTDLDQGSTEFEKLPAFLRKEFQCRTYAVIPMSSKVGMIEWVMNTVPLKDIITREMLKNKEFINDNPGCVNNNATPPVVDLTGLQAYLKRFEFVQKSHSSNEYHTMFSRASKAQAERLYSAITSKFPSNFIRNYILHLSASPEAFYTLRGEFSRSFAVNSVFGYILGIGDRHLENFLFDQKTGHLILIDFGVCFGIGASLLPVPEFIPFRLTRQLENVLQPLDGKSLLKLYMCKIFMSLRKDSISFEDQGGFSESGGLISNALSIYINDPVVDWVKGISRNDLPKIEAEEVKYLEDAEVSTWEPERRIQIALRKLRGEHPADLLIEDLKQNAFAKKLNTTDAIIKIIEESLDPSLLEIRNKAGKFNRKPIDVSEQVDNLLDLATAPNILARQWAGLQSWI